jgi:hypothetical protein
MSNIKTKVKSIDIWMLFSLFWILCFGICHSHCYAAPCYGTKMPGKKEFFTGVQSHSIFKRYLEDDYGKIRSTQYFFLLSYGVLDWLCIDLKGGAGNIKQHPKGADELDYASNFAGGYGLRLKLYDQHNSRIVFGFQHISVHPKSTHLGNTKNQAILDDWQTSILVSYDFKKATPHLGTRWSRLDYIHKVEDNRKRKMSDLTKSIGLIFGCDFSLTEKVWLNIESQSLDSEALAVSVNYKF